MLYFNIAMVIGLSFVPVGIVLFLFGELKMFNWLYSALSSPKQGEVWELKNTNPFNAKRTVVIDEIREKWVMYTTEQSFFLGNNSTRTLPISEFKQSFRKAL